MPRIEALERSPLTTLAYSPDSSANRCAGWLWYVFNDFWFYVISCFLVILLTHHHKRYQIIGKIIVVVLIIISPIWKIVIFMTCLKNPAGFCANNYLNDTYFRPWNRTFMYFLGFYFGFKHQAKQENLLNVQENLEETSTRNCKSGCKLFIKYIAWPRTFAILFIVSGYLQLSWDIHQYFYEPIMKIIDPNFFEIKQIFYFVVNFVAQDFLWCSAVVVIVTNIARQHSNQNSSQLRTQNSSNLLNLSYLLNKFLSSQIFTTFSKLSYSIYCAHFLVLTWLYTSVGQ